MAFQRSVIKDIPSEGLILDQFRYLISIFGEDVMRISLVKNDGGYSLHAHQGYQAKTSHYLKAEKSGKRRVFKSPETAFRICKELGFKHVTVEL